MPLRLPIPLGSLALISALVLTACDQGEGSSCPPEDYPISYVGTVDHTYWRGGSSSDDTEGSAGRNGGGVNCASEVGNIKATASSGPTRRDRDDHVPHTGEC